MQDVALVGANPATADLSSVVFLVISLVLAVFDWLAVARGRKRLEYVLKPATLVAIMVGAWTLTRGPHDVWEARFFLPGLAFSLAGDVLLMLPGERFFLPGLVAFLVGHVCYIVGLNPTLPPWPAFVVLVIVAAIGAILYRSIASGLRQQGQTGLLGPVALYSLVLSLMLFSAWATLFREGWAPLRQGLVIAGATLFFASDAMLAWDMFVTRSSLLRFLAIVTYHVGQMGLAGSIALWES